MNHNPTLPGGPPQPQPVAYDKDGRPLYAAPGQHPPNLVYLAKPINPIHQPISPEIQARHAASQKRYPYLNLSPGEYIISAVTRHPIGLLRIWAIALAVIVAFMAMFVMFFTGQTESGLFGTDMSAYAAPAIGILGVVVVMVLIGAMVATYVYNSNRFFLTNESVVQEIQTSLFAKHQQTVSLANIEDASYMQNGILPSLLNYGIIRLSTEGDETTYRFSYVTNPRKQIAILNNAVEAFKNGRPVDPHED